MTIARSTPFTGATWTEQKLRDALDRHDQINIDAVRDVLAELDQCRAALRRIQDVAQSHVDQKQVGYGFWESIVFLARKGLGS